MWFLLYFIFVCVGVTSSEIAPNCQYIMKEPRGVITTPNFPDQYPVPINCQWVIEAPSDKVIAIYFTQFYMREGLTATEYAYYSDNVKMGKTDFGTISSDREPTYLVSNKPVLVLNFNVKETANIHMRVREYLLDVFGFNITYEFLSRNESVRKDDCLYHHCSFTGNCYAVPGYDKYECSCFSKYFGDECQYDLECGPSATRNMCQNGGTCRYYIGSTVRTCECPPGYDGARCESKKLTMPKEIACSGPTCNKTCSEISDDGSGRCLDDEKRMRYVVTLKLTNPKVHTFYHDRKKTETFKKEMEHALSLLFKGRLAVMENITVIDVQLNAVMKFHMLAKEEDSEELNSTIEQMLELGKLGSFDFDHVFQDIYSEPALRILKIEVSEQMPVSEGSELTLACTVEGSSSLHVQWLRDGHMVRAHTTHRSTWTALVPRTSRQQYTALLGFDRVASLDSGTFTCEVTDWGFVRNRSIHVRVLSAPQPQMRPLAATIARGSPLVVTCLSKDDVRGDFGYTWLKNGRLLSPNAPETAEDLFPAGSRILLKEAEASATYSCIITSQAGSTKKDSIITVVNGDGSVPCCQPEDHLRVRWALTAANSENIQQCPTGYSGEVRRKCNYMSNVQTVEWEEPDFSGCFNIGFLNLKKKVDSLRLGYVISDTATLLSRLKKYLIKRYHFCEGEPVVDLLHDIYSIEHSENTNEEAWATFLNITSLLMESPILIKKFPKLILLNELIFKYGFQYAERTNEVSFELFERKAITVELGKLPGDLQTTLKLPSHKFASSNKFSDNQPMETINTVELDLTSFTLDGNNEGNSTTAFLAVWYKNLSSHVPHRYVIKRGVADVEYYLISSLVAVRLNDDASRSENVNVKISFTNVNNTIPNKQIRWNISCAMADLKPGGIQFTTNRCYLLLQAGNNSICQCNRLGTYALLLTHSSVIEEKHVELSYDAIAGSGCAICAFLVLITIMILLSLWRNIRGAIVTLKLQVCVALLGAFGIFFWGFFSPFSEEFFSYTVSLIQFFLLTAFSLQLCLALAVYIESVELKDVQYSYTKISALGWALPVIIVGATLAAQSLEGYVLKGWWLILGSNFFYAYTSSILILTMFQVLLFLIVKNEVRSHGKVADFLQSKKVRKGNNRIKLLHRSLLLTTTLLLMSLASILYVNFHQKIFEYFFAISSVLVGLVVFLSYTFCSEKHFLLCCLQENHDKTNDQEDSDIRSRTDSFKSFLRPEIVDDPYSRKMHIDAEKRAERIKRMYSQIEKASLSDSLNPHHNETTAELLSQRHYQHPESIGDDTHTPIFKPYQHASITSGSPRHLIPESDAFCDSLDRGGDGYPKMHWRYANHPHIMYGSPGSLSKHSKDQPVGAKRPLLMESDVDQRQTRPCDIVSSSEVDVCSKIPSTFISSSTFQPSQTVKADVLGSSGGVSYSETFNPLDNLDDTCSLKNSCFLQHTDSLETVVHCETTKKPLSEAPLKNISRDTSVPSQSWNMTTV